jgi:outer membrane protein assembly factor BamB
MFKLTPAQSNLINNSAYTHDYEAEADALYAASGADGTDVFTEQFERETGVLRSSQAQDLGGLIVYINGQELVAFYDYERFVGRVF